MQRSLSRGFSCVRGRCQEASRLLRAVAARCRGAKCQGLGSNSWVRAGGGLLLIRSAPLPRDVHRIGELQTGQQENAQGGRQRMLD